MRTADRSSPDDLWGRYVAHRSEEDRNRLVLHYAPLVKYVAGRLAATMPRHVEMDDLLSDGTIGLVSAVERFDPDRTIDFASFSISRIRGAMIDGLRRLDWLPRQVRSQITELEACTQRLCAALGRPPTMAELATDLGISVEEVGARQRHRDEARQLPLPAVDAIEDEHLAADRYGAAEPAQLPQAVVRELRGLPERDQVLIALYYYERLTMAEIGVVLGVTESRVSQLHQQIRRDLHARVTGAAAQVTGTRRASACSDRQ